MFLGQDYHWLAQASEQGVLPDRVTQSIIIPVRVNDSR